MKPPLFAGLLPIRRRQVVPEVLAGLTLAAVAIPETLGYATIAGMPVVTGLYTMLLPLVAFALLGSSRHLVVGADSATAAILAATLAGLASVGSPRYVQLAGTMALLAGVMLLLARVIRLGFLANFLSRTVLVGFLTGVGIQVAIGQLRDMLGQSAKGSGVVGQLGAVFRSIGTTNRIDLVICAGVAAIVLGARAINRRIPGALIAVVAAIAVSQALHLNQHGVEVLGTVPGGVPHLTVPGLALSDISRLLTGAVSVCVVILAQSSATSRAYAARYGEEVDENADLVGLGAANIAAAFTGTFVVNGSPTKTEIVDNAGGRSQLAQLSAGAVVLVALLVLTGTLAHLPLAALATVVFLIAVELIDIRGMRRILRVRLPEFVVAVITAAAVVFIGVEQGILLAIVASVVDHLRHSYGPHRGVLMKTTTGGWQAEPTTPTARSAPGLVIYRFGASLYFANASRFAADVDTLCSGADRPTWLCVDASPIDDIDFSAAAVLTAVARRLQQQQVALLFCGVIDPVREELDRYGITARLGANPFYDSADDVLDRLGRRPLPGPAP